MKEKATSAWKKYSSEIALTLSGGILTISLYTLGVNIAHGNESGMIGSGLTSVTIGLLTIREIARNAEKRNIAKEEIKYLREQIEARGKS